MTLAVFQIDQHLSPLIGFTGKTQQLIPDYEGVQQALRKKQISLVIFQHETGKGTIDKLRKESDKEKIISTKPDPGMDWLRMWGIPSHKIILGVVNGDLARNIIQKVRAGV